MSKLKLVKKITKLIFIILFISLYNKTYSRKLDTLSENSFYFINMIQNTYNYGGLNSAQQHYSIGIGWEKRFKSNWTVQNRFIFTDFLIKFEYDNDANQSNLTRNFQTFGYSVIPSYYTDWGLVFGMGFIANFNTDYNSIYNISVKNNNYNVKPNEMIFSTSPFISFRTRTIGNLEIEPELSYFIGLNNYLKDQNYDWSFNTLSFGIKIHWTTSYKAYIVESEIINNRETFIDTTNNLSNDSIYIFENKKNDSSETKEILNDKVHNLNDSISIYNETFFSNCSKGYKFNSITNNCEIEIPKSDQNCNGTYLGIQFNEIKNAENFQNYLKNELNINSFEIIQIQDVVDPKVIMFELQSGCFIDTQNAIESQRAIYDKLYPKSNFNEIEIILQTRK